MTIDKLFSMACNNDIKGLKKYFESGGEKNLRYEKFNSEHSLIMGAYRNNNFDTIKYLKSVGETLTEQEQKEIDEEFKRLKTLELLAEK